MDFRTVSLGSQTVVRLEDYRHNDQSHRGDDEHHSETNGPAYVRSFVEVPVEPDDPVDDRVHQGSLLPERGEHRNREEAPGEQGEGRNN